MVLDELPEEADNGLDDADDKEDENEPELPEVETVRNGLEQAMVGFTPLEVLFSWPT